MNSVKSAVLSLLNVYVSPYVENLNSQDLSLSLFSGNLQFHGLHLKKSLLERFGLPVEIVAGDIGTLSISIPWTALKTQPVKIAIDDVYVLARVRPQGKVDPEEDERVEQATKQEKLKSAEAVDNAASQVSQGSNDAAKQTYMGAIISKIVDNVQIHIKNIHVRYEDGSSTPEHPFAAGVTLKEFKAVSTDENWVEAFIQDSLQGVHKLVQLGALAVYFDTDAESLDKGPNDRAGTIAAVKEMLSGTPKHQYILKPVTGEARAIINKNMSNEIPKFDAQVIFDEIGVVIDRDQYRDVLSVVDVFHFYRRTHQYHKFRPPEEEFKENPAKARLKFAVDSIRAEVHDKNRRWSWAYLEERRDMRKAYVDMYVKKLALAEGKQLAAEDVTGLSEIETKASYEDIRFFRSVARAKAKKDAATRRKMEAERAKNQPQTQTWGQWIWGSSAKSSGENGGMSEEEKKEIDDIIDYDATAAASDTIDSTPRDFMKARVSAKLNKGSFALRTEPHGKNSDIIALVFDSFSADAVQLTDSVTGKIALGGFRVYDGTTPNSLYPQIVRVKDIEKAGKGKGKQETLEQEGGVEGAVEEIDDGLVDDVDPFFVMEVEHNPLDGRADNAVTVKMRHLEIIYHRGYVEAVVQFFKPPASQLESIGALLDAAGQTLDGIRKDTRAGLEYALEQHKTVDLRVDMNAPIIIIPMDVKVKQCQTLVLDAGHISVGSRLADKEQLKEVQSKRGRQYSEDDYKQLEDLMYDRLDLRLESTQLLMGDDVEACMEALDGTHHEASNELHILERIGMSFTVNNAITNAPNLTRFKIAGELPELHVNFSDRKYKSLMKFIDVSIPKFGDDDEQKGKAPAIISDDSRARFRSQKIEEYNFDDDRSIISTRTVEDKDDGSSTGGKGDHFYEAHDEQTESQRSALRQVTFEFSFSVGKLQASLFKSTSPTTERPLADAVLEGFGLTFALRKWDMSVDLFLRSVTLAMIEQGSARRPLLSSANEGGDSPSDLKLVQVKYLKVQKESPEFMTKHDGVDTSIDTELSTFKITMAPEPILSLYDFIMTTFVPKDDQAADDAGKGQQGQENEGKEEEQEKSTDKLRVRVKLTSAQVSLENNDNRFALLALPSADVAILLRGGTLRVGARLGNISLEDLSEEPVADPAFKKLLAIEGGELADFSYETFDPSDEETFPGYNSSINLRAGSFKFTFMERPVRDLYAFALKFARMKAVYDAAQQAAVQRASEVTRMHFDVVVKTPIIVLPRDGVVSPDRLVLRLGEIVAKNEYLNDPNDTSTIDASLRGINVASEITVDEKKGTLQMVDDVAITAVVKQAGDVKHREDPHHADTEITTEMSDVKMSLTQRQYILLMGVLESLPRALSSVGDSEVSPESMPETPANLSTPPTPISEEPPEEQDPSVSLEPELAVVKAVDHEGQKLWTALDFVFSVGQVALEIYGVDALQDADLKGNSIARFALVKTHLGFKKLSDDAMEAEFSLKTLSFKSTRSGSSVFRDIIPPADHEGNQVMLQYTKAGGTDQSALAIVTVDSPRFILAVDPLAALLEFAVSPFKKPADVDAPPAEEEQEEEEIEEGPKSGGSLAFRVEIIHATVIVIADDTNPKTQAIQLNIKEVLLSQQSILALKIERIGMSFGRMDQPRDRVKFLDDLNIALSLDTRRRGSQQMTSFEVEIPDPIIFRASYTDIMLIGDIASKATAVATKALAPAEEAKDEAKTGADSSAITGGESTADASSMAVVTTKQSRRQSSTARRSSISRRRQSLERGQVIVSKEQLKARINGFQFVVVADLQEMPVLHLSTNEFSVAVNDWSGDMKMATSITTSIRYFNLTNSYFEPLMDPWTFDLRVNRVSAGPGNNPLNVKLSARERLELNLTSAFIELAITSFTVWSKKEEERTKTGKTDVAPFRIRNCTGITMLLWREAADVKTVSGVKQLEDGADVPWRFEDKKHTRDNVSAVRHNSLGIQLKDMPWEPIRSISVDREGEHILSLRPRIDRVVHQLTCEVKLENNIKIVTFRSTLNVENHTSLPVEMIVVDAHGKASQAGAMIVPPGGSCPLPVRDAFEKRFRLRPLRGFGFDFSWSMPLHWKQLMSRPIRPISCKHQTPKEPAFYFQAQANYNPKDAAAKIYPRMSLVLRAPVELENLLPYDLKFRIHDKNTGLSSSSFLVRGGSSPIHTVELSHLLLLNVHPEDTNFKQSDYAIINTDDPELPIEDNFQLSDEQGLKHKLKLHYMTYPNSGGAFKVQVYTPFIFMNKTGLPFDLSVKTWTGGQKPIAGRDLFANDFSRDTPTPFMFGFPNDDRRERLQLRVNDSKWSQPLSFEPVAADMQIVMASASGDKDNLVGLSYIEALGKYKLTKVITIAPRYMVKNTYARPIKVRQYATRDEYVIGPGERIPIHELRQRAPPQLIMAFDEPNMEWSAPFNIADIGRTNLTIRRKSQGAQKTYLMRVETHIEGASIFLYISREKEDAWPLKLHNDTKLSLKFRQKDDDMATDKESKRPLHSLSENSQRTFAWDWPTAANKRIALYVDAGEGKLLELPNAVDMMAIGIQTPMKIPAIPNQRKSQTVSIDVRAEGGSQMLTISPYNEETSVYKPSRPNGGIRRSDSTSSLSSSTMAFETVAVSEKPTLTVTVDFEGIGISVITKGPNELLYLSLRGLKLGYTDYPQYYDAYVDCKWIQIDNQLFGGLFPIILYPTVVPKDGKELESHPTLQASVALLKDQSHGVVFVKYATILLQALTIELDEDFMFALLDFVKFKDAAWKDGVPDILIEHPKEIPEPDISTTKADVFFEALQLQPMTLELSFMRTDRVNVEEKVETRSNNPFYYALNALTMTIGNVNAAPLAFRALFLENVRLSIPSLQERVRLHYQEQFISQIYRVLGSADFLGNPVGLFNNISSGFSDIFYEPYQGIVMHGNKDIGLGIARGATSFAKKTVFGISDSVTKFTGSIGKGLSAATLDQEFQSKRRMTQRRNKPKHALYGVAAGASAFADSMTSAFEGVASKPMEGAEKGGAAGFAKGVGKGFVGLFTKPVVGVMDFVSASTEGIRNTTTVFDQAELDRVRLPRFIASDGVLRPFSSREALGQSWLKDLDAGAFFNDSYIAHIDLPGDDAVSILSNNRILQVQLRRLRVLWQVPFEELQSLSLEANGINLVNRDGRGGPFLPIPEQTAREWYFKQIGRVVTAYNKSHSQAGDV
ncbi:hypothetical protein IAT38_004901 [Cryptococcus sp. DSM 104549]